MAISRSKHLIFSTFTYRQISLAFLSSSSQTNLPLHQNLQNETLISSVVSILREQRSKSRWNFIKSLYPCGFSPNEVSQIMLHVKNNPHLALRFFLWSEKKSLCKHDLLSYSTIIHILARARSKNLAQTLIQTAIRVSEVDDPDLSSKPPKIFETLAKTYRSCDSAPFVFDLLIKACLQARKIDRAISIVRMLRSRWIYPTIGTCNSLIRSVSRLRGSDAGFAIYKEILGLDDEIEHKVSKVRVSPNVQTFNTLMLSFYQDGIMEKVEEIWVEMEKYKCEPNVFSYSVAMAGFCDDGKMARALRLWEEMRIGQTKPDVMAYNTLISGFCKIGEMGRAEELFQEMALMGTEATCLTYEHLIKGYCSIGDIDSAIFLYKDMSRKDFRPEASTVDEMIGGMCDKSKVSEGLEFLRDVMKKLDLFPSRTSYEFLIKGLCKEGKMEEALKLQTEMVGKGFEPNLETYSAFVDGYMKQGNEEMAVRLRKEMFEIRLQLGSAGTNSSREELSPRNIRQLLVLMYHADDFILSRHSASIKSFQQLPNAGYEDVEIKLRTWSAKGMKNKAVIRRSSQLAMERKEKDCGRVCEERADDLCVKEKDWGSKVLNSLMRWEEASRRDYTVFSRMLFVQNSMNVSKLNMLGQSGDSKTILKLMVMKDKAASSKATVKNQKVLDQIPNSFLSFLSRSILLYPWALPINFIQFWNTSNRAFKWVILVSQNMSKAETTTIMHWKDDYRFNERGNCCFQWESS
ncbi:hypothetical protein HHK36_003145 [Tetracentron sinense]|uniref:Pentatricopeptide repeat-containing protein n=1 Tax=Tetracentron sinense TaxID=13715 RepID=A0A835DNM4_TETSI|nr:hypothetical protein HHK36_003145 [Tetracentron sinense]